MKSVSSFWFDGDNQGTVGVSHVEFVWRYIINLPTNFVWYMVWYTLRITDMAVVWNFMLFLANLL